MASPGRLDVEPPHAKGAIDMGAQRQAPHSHGLTRFVPGYQQRLARELKALRALGPASNRRGDVGNTLSLSRSGQANQRIGHQWPSTVDGERLHDWRR